MASKRQRASDVHGVAVGLGFLAALLTLPAEAGPPRQHGAHVHGHGRLDVVLDGGTLQAELTAPGADLVGFEHPPRDVTQTGAVQSAVTALHDGGRVLGLPTAAACRQEAVVIDSAMLAGAEDHDDDHGDHHDDDDDGERDQRHAHDDDHATPSGGHAAEEHAEFRISYRFTCAHPEKLDALAVGYFAAFERANELAVQAVGPWGQTSQTLTRAAPRLTFQ